MIIHRIHAENVLKYRSLKLDDLPERGLIAITGPNESGKSTIGETLCFALFGRTFSLDYDDLNKVIHWGETHCSVEVDFTASDGEKYTLERFLDDSGNHSARIAKTNQALGEEPLARGIEKVADLVYQLIGYEYEEFIESFYLAQREITTPHPHSYAVKTMAGLVTLEYSAAAFKEEREEAEALIDATQKEATTLGIQIEEVDIDPDYLPGLETERNEVSTQLETCNRELSALERASVDYQDALPKKEAALKSRSRAGLLRFVFFLLTLITGGTWFLLAQLPEHTLSVALADTLSTNVPDWHAGMIPWLLYATIGFALLFFLFWMRRSSQEKSLKQLAEAGHELSAVLDRLAPLENTDEAQVKEPAVADESLEEPSAETEEPMTAPAAEVVNQAAREKLSQRVSELMADFAEVREGVGNEQSLLRDVINRAQERIGQLDEAITQEQGRIGKVEALTSMQHDLQQKCDERQHHIEMCDLAGDLIQGTMREISYQFNRKVRGLVSKTLPLFTENRYEHLQIDDDLSVRAFSSEKHDFMDLDEISSGTQRQIMLAVRLALSQELVSRAVNAGQFLFLDEPFAFFDQSRTRSSLIVLPTLSDQLSQIWIIGQEFPDDLAFDRHIRCDRKYQTIPPLDT